MKANAAVGLILLVSCAACSGGGGSGDASRPANATETSMATRVGTIDSDSSGLLQSAIEASLAATSYKSTISFSISQDGGGVERYTGEMHQRAPADLYIRLKVDGMTIEFLALPPDLYIRGDSGTWCSIPADAADEFRSLAAGQSIDEWADLLTNLEGVRNLDNETIAGVKYAHLRGTFDLATYIRSLPPNQVDRDALEGANFIRPGTVDVYIDPITKLVGRMDMEIELATPDGNGRIIFHADFDAYNDASGFPSEPQGAPEFEGFSDTFC
jgi:hypothetical protein